ncbi:hypothetical protein [Pedobacter panaciterrae]|uniref:Uncharacterized protein n=1 Tax=Pedobacter panaciterrae TaxID=363849 RepID=A0ABU8NIG8_9SPHI
MPLITLSAHNNHTIDGPHTVTVAPGTHTENRSTQVHVSFMKPGGGGGSVTFQITNNHKIFGNGGQPIPHGTTSVHIINQGPETINISWV